MILVDGLSQDTVSIQDRSVQYGDGVFETIAVREGVPMAWDLHLRRLYAACTALDLNQPDEAVLMEDLRRVCADQEKVVVKIILTRGEGGRGYSPAPGSNNRRIVAAYAWPDYPADYSDKGIVAGISEIRLGHNPVLAGIKHLNRLEQVLIARELADNELVEAIVLDIDDAVTEGSKSNIFLVKNEVLYTPRLDMAGVNGVIREAILQKAAEEKMEMRVEKLDLDDLFRADEVFFCNSVAGIWPVRLVDEKEYSVGPFSIFIRNSLVANNIICQ